MAKKTAKMSFDTVKDSDGWCSLGYELGWSESKISRMFEYGEYGAFWIEVDEDGNIVGGRLIPCGKS